MLFRQKEIMDFAYQFQDHFKKLQIESKQRASCNNNDATLQFIKGVIGCSHVQYKKYDIWLFGERHVDLAESCESVDAYDIKLKRRRQAMETRFTGSDCRYFTFPRMLYAWFSKLKLESSSVTDFYLERPMLTSPSPIRPGKTEVGYLHKLLVLFADCFFADKTDCFWMPEIWTHAVDLRVLTTFNFSCPRELSKFQGDYILEHGKLSEEAIQTYLFSHGVAEKLVQESVYFTPLFFYQAAWEYLMEKSEEPVVQTKDRFQRLAEFQHIIHMFYGEDFSGKQLLHTLLESDDYHIDPPREEESMIVPFLLERKYCGLLTAFLYYKLMATTSAGRKKFTKVLPDGRIVSRQRAQLLALDDDNVMHNGTPMSELIKQWALSFPEPIIPFSEMSSSSEISNNALRALKFEAFWMDIYGLSRMFRKFGGKRKQERIIGYFGDQHRVNWTHFFTTMLNAEVDESTKQDHGDLAGCLKLTAEMRDDLLRETGIGAK